MAAAPPIAFLYLLSLGRTLASMNLKSGMTYILVNAEVAVQLFADENARENIHAAAALRVTDTKLRIAGVQHDGTVSGALQEAGDRFAHSGHAGIVILLQDFARIRVLYAVITQELQRGSSLPGLCEQNSSA